MLLRGRYRCTENGGETKKNCTCAVDGTKMYHHRIAHSSRVLGASFNLMKRGKLLIISNKKKQDFKSAPTDEQI